MIYDFWKKYQRKFNKSSNYESLNRTQYAYKKKSDVMSVDEYLLLKDTAITFDALTDQEIVDLVKWSICDEIDENEVTEIAHNKLKG